MIENYKKSNIIKIIKFVKIIYMKKYIAIILFSISVNFLYSQSNINLPTWNVSKLYVNGLTNNDITV